jgi:predicted negative regulator of RcsB-dependent stress response
VDDLLSEKEQIEQMRAWWAEYGRYVIAGVVIAVGLLLGFNQYQNSKLDAQTAASRLFETLAEHVTDGNLDQAEAVAAELATDFAKTSYAAQSRLAMARLYMDKNRDEDAADALRELLEMPAGGELKPIATLRLARILLYQDKAQEVVDLLESLDDPAFAALASEILGDAYVALGRHEDAGEAYRTALADPTQPPTIDRGLVQMKLVDLPDDTEAPATAPAAEPAAEAAEVVAPEAAEAALGEGEEEAGEAR